MKPVKTDVTFPQLEEETLRFWKEKNILEKGLRANHGKKPFVFYDGPPFATGLPHYGHILAGTLKDIVPRYWVMRGHYVERRWGWDCHGLPVEFEMENELGLSGAYEVEKYGVAKFNDACKGIVLRYTKEWEEVILRTGRWADFKDNYRTMDMPFMESVWWVIQQLWNKGLIYQGYRVMPYSWRIGTPLSNFEASLNYKEVQDPALTVRFKSKKAPNRYLLAWTTTPWTLPSNMALAVNQELTYQELKSAKTGETYVVASGYEGKLFEGETTATPISGKSLLGETYEPLFPFFKDSKGAFRVVHGEHVTATDGTGIVHTAPAFGEEDFTVCKREGIPVANPVDAGGKFTSQVPPYQGQNVKEADKAIIKDLKAAGSVVKHETYVHNYPFCWRSDTPLINYAIPAWFVKLDPIKERLVKNNHEGTRWVPDHLRDGRFGNWLESARDWNISRNRFWGTPIPLWKCGEAKCEGIVCVGSSAELEKLSGQKLNDLHKQFVDEVQLPCPKCKKPMKRIPEVLDCWFESGSMPYAQQHYPFENKERFEKNFPADFIAEGIDQTRGWFYTLSVLSTALFDKPPFKNVIVNGLVLASDGKKMSKRLKNYPDPKHILDTYGADALRAYLMSSPASHADDLRFSEAGVKEIVRSVLLPFWNAYSFFVTYALADDWKPKELGKLEHEFDRWIVSRLHSLIGLVDEKMENYLLYEVIHPVLQFIDELTNWYIRLNRRRFWSEDDAAFRTLYYVLTEFSKVLAPVLPFVTDAVYQNLRSVSDPESVHLSAWPKRDKKRIDSILEAEMAIVQQILFLGRTIRDSNKLKTRQPLKELMVISAEAGVKDAVEKHMGVIASEINVKKVSFSTDEAKWVDYVAKPNAKVLGPKLGKKMQSILAVIKGWGHETVAQLEKKGEILVDGEKITPTDVTIERKPKKEGVIQTGKGITVWMDNTLNDELVREGQAREFVNRVQKLRKDLGFDVSDRIRVTYQCPQELETAILAFESYIISEVLAEKLSSAASAEWNAQEDIDGHPLKLRAEKI